jgi:hypothetical protein
MPETPKAEAPSPTRRQRWSEARRLAKRHPAVVWLAMAVVIASALIAVWPDWVLRYGRVFAWPVVAAAIAIGFRSEIGGLFRDRQLAELHLPGGARARFTGAEQPPPGQDPIPELPVDAVAVNGDVASGVLDEQAAEVERLQMELEAAQGGIRFFALFSQLFAIQLDFLIHLRGALPDGLTAHAAQEWFNTEFVARPQFVPAAWNAGALLNWLAGSDFIRVTPAGNYAMGDMGNRLLWSIDQNFWYAPKIW